MIYMIGVSVGIAATLIVLVSFVWAILPEEIEGE
jgi:nitrogen fixation-related uncharacterized protein